MQLYFTAAVLTNIEFRIDGIEVFTVQIILNDAQAFTEPLIMNNLTFSQETYRIADFWVFHQSQDIVISCSLLSVPQPYLHGDL